MTNHVPMRRLMSLVAVSLIAALVCSTRATAQSSRAPGSKRVLLITGEDYPGHKWKETAPVLKQLLAKDERLTIDVLDDLRRLPSTDLEPYAAVIIHFKNYDPLVPGRKGFEKLESFVRKGGGCVMVHFSCGAFEEFKADFVKLAGRVWFGIKPPAGRSQHDPRGKFTVHIDKLDHPITRGMSDFETVDELYTCLEGTTPITTLATAQSKRDGKPYPMAFVLPYGKGRVFQTVLGHDVTAFEADGPSTLIRRACAWAAGLTPK